MVHRPANRTPDQIIDDYLSAKARTDFLGDNFKVSQEQRDELKKVLDIYGPNALSRSRKGGGLSKKTLENTIPRFLKFGLSDYIGRIEALKTITSRSSWEFYCIIYGEEEASRVWEQKAKKCALSEERLGKEKWKEWLDKRSGNLLSRWSSQMSPEEAKQKYIDYKKTLSRAKSLDGYIERYGKIDGLKKYQERYNGVHSKEYKTYARKVHRLSGKVYNEHIDTINPNRYPRTLNGVEGGWQLDHIIPIKECYKQGKTPEEASDVSNLRMLPWKQNLMRNYNKKCQ